MQNKQTVQKTIPANSKSLEKVKRLSTHIQELGAKLLQSQGNVASSAYGHSPSELALALFSRANPNFLDQRSIPELTSISLQCVSCLETHSKQPSAPSIQFEERESFLGVSVALGDRPFIINSILECLRELNLTVGVLLHPVLTFQEQRISLSYFEIPKIGSSFLELLSRKIHTALSDLILCTNDFSAMLARTESLAHILQNSRFSSPYPQGERSELANFLHWLTDGAFVFLGYSAWQVSGGKVSLNESHNLGLQSSADPHLSEILSQCETDVSHLLRSNSLYFLTRLAVHSPVHHRERLNHFVIREISAEGRTVSIHSLIGLLTSKAVAQESSSIPLIRQKLQRIFELEDVLENSFDHKNILSIADGMPEEEALRYDVDRLQELVTQIVDAQTHSKTLVHVAVDIEGRSALVTVVMPRDAYSPGLRRELQALAETKFNAQPKSCEYRIDVASTPWVRLYLHIPISSARHVPVNFDSFKEEFVQLTRSWYEGLAEKILISPLLKNRASMVVELYKNAFSEEYQALHSVAEAQHDINILETLSNERPIRVSMAPGFDVSHNQFTLIVYSYGNTLTISAAVPIFENVGLEVISEKSSNITPSNSQPLFVHRFLVRSKVALALEGGSFENIIAPGLEAVFSGRAENDALNSLMLSVALPTRAIALIRTYSSLLYQVSRPASRPVIQASLTAQPERAVQLWKMFELLFKPGTSSIEARRKSFNDSATSYRDELRLVTDITKDRILRSIVTLLEHTVRTNFYTGNPSIALKIHSEAIDIMPSPKPVFEIFVSAPDVEGVHLRGSRVARGGLRWSDRYDDYRSEVLGLMKTQKIKNAVIVPGGAKGGFVVKQLPSEGTLVAAAVESAYKTFIRSLLSLTDNRVGTSIKHPEGLIIHDIDDPYLVVAADKGTATFSDTANKIAINEFSFWLGDAFASGGSQGYDHKLYGITAKGAWECVLRHFSDMNFNCFRDSFTAIGIGDMAGDVFGNGLILSENYKLIAAFNHKHIFIDPNPDPKVSFGERVRLFNLKGSQWSDYRKELISEGGGIFGRYDKEIFLSPLIRESLSIPDSAPKSVNGEQLINLILKAEIDLLWNGGIGTYVKATEESDAAVNDGTNDRVRVNASELRTKIVAEGGNLGFTQRARVEYAQLGGRINTDAIDNSGGVDLSDHEVNIKILFTGLLRDKKVTLEERDKLLKEMAHEVTELVLDHNRGHALLLTMAVERSSRKMDFFQSLIREMHRLGYVNRHLECLPEDEDLRERASRKQPMTRPELAVCTSAVKMWLKEAFLASDFAEDPLLKDHLMEYFPAALQQRFPNELVHHPLAANITATQVANMLVESVGITFIHRMCSNYAVAPAVVIKCALAAEAMLNTRKLRATLRRFDVPATSALFLKAQYVIGRGLKNATSWLLSTHQESVPLSKLIQSYHASYKDLAAEVDKVLTGRDLVQFNQRVESWKNAGFDKSLSNQMAILPAMVTIFEILWSTKHSGRDMKRVAQAFGTVLETFLASTYVSGENLPESSSKWEAELLLGSADDIRRSLSQIACKALELGCCSSEEVIARIQRSPNFERVKATIEEAKSDKLSVAAISVVAKQLRVFTLH